MAKDSSGRVSSGNMPDHCGGGEITSPLASCEDGVLIQMAITGRDDCFSLLMHRHLNAVRKHLRSLVSNEYDLDDLIQEVLLKVWQNLATFRSESKLRTWIIRIGINEGLQFYRRRKCRPMPQPLTDCAGMVSPEESPLQQLVRAEKNRKVRCSVARLPQQFREVMTLRYLHELGDQQTAQRLQLSVPSVKARLFRARRMLSTRAPELVGAAANTQRLKVLRSQNGEHLMPLA